MSTIEQPAETAGRSGPSTVPAAIGVVLFITVIAALVMLMFAFRTTNTDSSINGETATTSSYTGDDQAP